MTKKGGLGRGLSALIGTAVPVATDYAAIKEAPTNTDKLNDNKSGLNNHLNLKDIIANPLQPRQVFTESELRELSDSIKTYGVLQPILVRPVGSFYEIVAGERRYRAAKEAGLTQVPVVIKEMSDREAFEVALVENVQRQGLTPIEESKGYQRLIDEFSLSASEIAERVGKDRATVSNSLRLLKLPPLVMEMLEKGEISTGHAKAILTVKEPQAMIGLANKVKNEGLSVRTLEAIVSRKIEMPERKEEDAIVSRAMKPSVHTEIEDRIRRKLGTKVRIAEGKIAIYYHSTAEFERIIELIDA